MGTELLHLLSVLLSLSSPPHPPLLLSPAAECEFVGKPSFSLSQLCTAPSRPVPVLPREKMEPFLWICSSEPSTCLSRVLGSPACLVDGGTD